MFTIIYSIVGPWMDVSGDARNLSGTVINFEPIKMSKSIDVGPLFETSDSIQLPYSNQVYSFIVNIAN